MKKAAILLRAPGVWSSLLDEYFSEVAIEKYFGSEAPIQSCDLIFIESAMCQMPVIQKIRTVKNLNHSLRVFSLGEALPECANLFDATFQESCNLFDFSKKIADKISLPDSIRLLVADDDPDIRNMVCDYFEGRYSPAFEVLRASNGREAYDWVLKKPPQAMIIDIKMPVMKGSELYCKLQKQNYKIPTIIFFDSISASDLDTIKKAGNPVTVEKGYRDSSMSYMMALVKKLVYFAS